jgi:hypothetical protein
MKIYPAFLALLAVVPAAAQNAPGKAVATFTPPSCGEPGKELETNFELTVPKAAASMKLVYTGCSEEGRNDLLPGYTERYYKGQDGFSLTLVTEHGDGAYSHSTDSSDVLVAKGKDWVARFGTIHNTKLASGDTFREKDFALRAAVVKAAAIPSVPACEANLPKPIYGPVTLMLLTKTKAYYYHEDCDICAELDSCDVKTGKLKEEIVAHMVSCEDAKALAKGQEIVYDGCNQGYR